MNEINITGTVLARIAAIERQNRLMKAAFIALAACLILAVLLGAADTVPKILDAQGLTIRGSDGRIRAKLEATTDGGIVQTLMDKSGTERIRFAVNGESEARIWINDDEGEVRVAAFSFPTGSKDAPLKAGLSIIGAGKGKEFNKKPGISLATTKDGEAIQSLFDASVSTYLSRDSPTGA